MSLRNSVYLDYAAATPVDPRVIDAMVHCLKLDGAFANPSSKDHAYGWEAAEAVENARGQIADLVGCSPLELVFTSGATESNNLALFGLARALRKQGDKRRTIITSKIEHKAVLEGAAMLEEDGYKVIYLDPRADSTFDVDLVEPYLTEDVFLVSISQANSVTGAVTDMHALADLCWSCGIYYHSDCAQSAGYEKQDLSRSHIALVSLTPEKICGPKGVGALFINRALKVPLEPMIVGGGQERGLRGGTVATHQAAGMGMAFELMAKEGRQDKARLEALRQRMIDKLTAGVECIINGSAQHHLPHILSVSFPGINGALLLPSLSDTACSSGSACSSAELKPSYVLTALGMDDNLARASLRLSVGRFTTEEEIDRAADDIIATVKKLRQ
ncbi:MAG: aminotransferase class V-fold PLP-dependent enzyme [Proteobacteria bacterium]|uniref:Aminotransferase class V-fold PLP-dependent enzyme n=1 Tax=Candidatus Avisuccinivibrio stercorigallinarum TaxID=2840704 RepID=A0A9D9GSF4_9GAMM|nr:aminotransferase class V-fold PLP-dependent enzyme [Candidatus Avisuccinivibrio stercorigallinarum]